MARVPELKREELSEHQLRLATELGATRSGGLETSGPYGLLLRNAELCERGGKFGSMLRNGTSVPQRLSEIAIVLTARTYTADFEWYAHAPEARHAGVSDAVLEAIRCNQRPAFEHEDEAAVYDYVSELHLNKRVADATYRRLVTHLGETGAIELTAITGFYTTIAMLIVAFEVDLPKGMGRQFTD